MLRKTSILKCLLLIVLISDHSYPVYAKSKIKVTIEPLSVFQFRNEETSDPDDKSASLKKINSEIRVLSLTGNASGLRSISDSLTISLNNRMEKDSSFIAELYYNIGVCKLLVLEYKEALKWLKLSVGLKEHLNIVDDHYGKGLYNIGVAYNYLCDYNMVCYYMLEYIRIGKELYGEKSPELIDGYSTLLATELELYDYEKFAEFAILALGTLNNYDKNIDPHILTKLYNNIGIGYFRMGDLAKARIYFEEAESMQNKNRISQDENYINIINSLAVVYGSLGLAEKEAEYFDKGIELAVTNNSYIAFNMINTYVIGLGNSGKINKGEALLAGVVEKARKEIWNQFPLLYRSAQKLCRFFIDL